jgi:hypothetical protein
VVEGHQQQLAAVMPAAAQLGVLADIERHQVGALVSYSLGAV